MTNLPTAAVLEAFDRWDPVARRAGGPHTARACSMPQGGLL
jgi:hypothetical protein